jgi:hypothetical protein
VIIYSRSEKDSYWCLRSSWARDPKCDDMLMMLSSTQGIRNEQQPVERPSIPRRPVHKMAARFWASEADIV